MFILIAALALALPEQPVARLSASQVLAVAADFHRSGNDDQALALYEGLDADPSPQIRVEALLRRAVILDKRGQTREAAVLLRKVVDTRPAEGAPRIVLARLLEKVDDVDGAREQLRAAQAGNLTSKQALLADRYANALRARAPYGWSVEVSLAPDSNINRATASDTLQTVIGKFDLNRDGRSRSGVGIAARGSGFVRLSLSDNASWLARAEGSHDRYGDANFNRSTLAFSTGPELALGRTRLAIEGGVGQSSFGGDAYQRWGQISARAYRPIGNRTGLRLNLSGAQVDNLVNDLQDGRLLQATAGIDHALTPTLGLQGQVTVGRFDARDPGYSTRSFEASLGGWLDLGRFTLTASAARGRLDADERLLLFSQKRQDRSTRLSLGVATRGVRVLTFSPFVRVNWELNQSSVEIWDYRRRRIEVGLQRAY